MSETAVLLPFLQNNCTPLSEGIFDSFIIILSLEWWVSHTDLSAQLVFCLMGQNHIFCPLLVCMYVCAGQCCTVFSKEAR